MGNNIDLSNTFSWTGANMKPAGSYAVAVALSRDLNELWGQFMGSNSAFLYAAPEQQALLSVFLTVPGIIGEHDTDIGDDWEYTYFEHVFRGVRNYGKDQLRIEHSAVVQLAGIADQGTVNGTLTVNGTEIEIGDEWLVGAGTLGTTTLCDISDTPVGQEWSGTLAGTLIWTNVAGKHSIFDMTIWDEVS